MYKSWKKIAVFVLLAVLFAVGSATVMANPELTPGTPIAPGTPSQPGSPLAPDGWTTGNEEEVADMPARVHILHLVVGQYNYTQDGTPQHGDAAPFIINGRTMVPLRLIERTMGITVTQNDALQMFVITQGTMAFALQMNQPLPNNMGTPMMHNGELFVPLRFVAESLGAEVHWDRATRSIKIEWSWQPPANIIVEE
ncbi:MAG: copper amine oxidase N-terminal domain-containing protein [Defluviitaleaceae bacterium]|nr:copper amine oxidase N-terminal domain-containing protein [Defluviitaleaceae bacterium]